MVVPVDRACRVTNTTPLAPTLTQLIAGVRASQSAENGGSAEWAEANSSRQNNSHERQERDKIRPSWAMIGHYCANTTRCQPHPAHTWSWRSIAKTSGAEPKTVASLPHFPPPPTISEHGWSCASVGECEQCHTQHHSPQPSGQWCLRWWDSKSVALLLSSTVTF